MVQRSTLGRQIGSVVLCQRPAAGAGAWAQARAGLPAELAQRVAAAAAPAGAAGAAGPRLELPVPTAARACPLYAELAAVDASLADLVLGMLCYDPAQRITAQQVGAQERGAGLCWRALFGRVLHCKRMASGTAPSHTLGACGARPPVTSCPALPSWVLLRRRCCTPSSMRCARCAPSSPSWRVPACSIRRLHQEPCQAGSPCQQQRRHPGLQRPAGQAARCRSAPGRRQRWSWRRQRGLRQQRRWALHCWRQRPRLLLSSRGRGSSGSSSNGRHARHPRRPSSGSRNSQQCSAARWTHGSSCRQHRRTNCSTESSYCRPGTSRPAKRCSSRRSRCRHPPGSSRRGRRAGSSPGGPLRRPWQSRRRACLRRSWRRGSGRSSAGWRPPSPMQAAFRRALSPRLAGARSRRLHGNVRMRSRPSQARKTRRTGRHSMLGWRRGASRVAAPRSQLPGTQQERQQQQPPPMKEGSCPRQQQQ